MKFMPHDHEGRRIENHYYHSLQNASQRGQCREGFASLKPLAVVVQAAHISRDVFVLLVHIV